MSQFNFLTTQISNKKRDYTVYTCPYCNNENKMNSSECIYCNKSLLEIESIIFAKYNNYNEALELVKNNKYISALEKICGFLERFPDDIDGNRLRLYILKQLNDEEFELKAEAFMKTSSDRWVAKLLDTPELVSIDDLTTKESFKGIENFYPANCIIACEQEKIKFVNNIKETVNSLYSMYIRLKSTRKFDKIKYANEFISFYEKIFLRFLSKNNIEVKNYFGLNLFDLSEEEKKCIANIETIYKKKEKDGFINEVFYPEIKYNGFFVQRTKITVIQNPTKHKEKK